MSDSAAKRQWILEHVDHEDAEKCLIWPFGPDVIKTIFAPLEPSRPINSPLRVMCEYAHGLPPEGSNYAVQTCNGCYEGCLNPHHIKWCSGRERYEINKKRGTVLTGENHPSSKLSADDVREIRKSKMSERELGALYGVSRLTINAVLTRRTWKDLK